MRPTRENAATLLFVIQLELLWVEIVGVDNLDVAYNGRFGNTVYHLAQFEMVASTVELSLSHLFFRNLLFATFAVRTFRTRTMNRSF